MKKIIGIILVGIVASCTQEKTGNEISADTSDSLSVVTLTETQYQVARIEVSRISEHPMGTTLKLNGILDVPPQNLISISAPMGGFVRSTKLLQGMKVRKGDILATMENQEYIQMQQDYLENKSKLEFLEAEYIRQQELAKENVNAQKTLQQAKSQFQTVQATVKGLKAKLAMINIAVVDLESGDIRQTINLYAPINGFVTVVNVNVGQFVNPSDVLFKIVNIEHIHAELQVYEKDINKIRIGQKVSFQLAHEEGVRSASVYLIGKEISAQRSVRIHCHLDKEDESLLPGMYVTATVETSTHNAKVIPSGAVVSYAGKDYIFASTGKQSFELVPVVTGSTDDQFTEVQFPKDFDLERDVVIKGAFELLGMLKNSEEE